MMTGLTHAERRERRKEIAEAVRGGSSVETVCKEHGVSRSWTHEACKEFGVSITPAREEVHTNSFEILASLLNSTETLQAIADDFKVTKQRVSQILQKARAAGILFHHRPRNEKS